MDPETTENRENANTTGVVLTIALVAYGGYRLGKDIESVARTAIRRHKAKKNLEAVKS